jgi:hypothetical protein
MIETCENCGTEIGKLETPFIWIDHVVCATCYARLDESPAQPTDSKTDSEAVKPLSYETPLSYSKPIPAASRSTKLVSCPDCGGRMSNMADACPACGWVPGKAQAIREFQLTQSIQTVIGVGVFIIGIVVCCVVMTTGKSCL